MVRRHVFGKDDDGAGEQRQDGSEVQGTRQESGRLDHAGRLRLITR
jgi:hypothetical protein